MCKRGGHIWDAVPSLPRHFLMRRRYFFILPFCFHTRIASGACFLPFLCFWLLCIKLGHTRLTPSFPSKSPDVGIGTKTIAAFFAFFLHDQMLFSSHLVPSTLTSPLFLQHALVPTSIRDRKGQHKKGVLLREELSGTKSTGVSWLAFFLSYLRYWQGWFVFCERGCVYIDRFAS